MASETPLTLNIAVDALWDQLPCRHTVITWGQPPQSAEAVLVYMGQDRAVFFLPAAGAEGSQGPLVTLTAQGEDGADLGSR